MRNKTKKQPPKDALATIVLPFLNAEPGENLNPGSDQPDSWICYFKIRGKWVCEIPNGLEVFRKERDLYRGFVDVFLCSNGRDARPEELRGLEKMIGGAHSFLEPKLIEQDADQNEAIKRWQEELKPFDYDPDKIKRRGEDTANGSLQRALMERSRNRLNPEHPLVSHFVVKKTFDDRLSLMYAFLLEELKSGRHRIGKCQNAECRKYFYRWPQTPDQKSCSDKCRYKKWIGKPENNKATNEKKKLLMREHRKQKKA